MIEEDDLFRSNDFSLRQLVGGDVASVPIVFSADNRFVPYMPCLVVSLSCKIV